MSISLYPWLWTGAAAMLLMTAYASYGGASMLFLLVVTGLIMLQGAVVQAGRPRMTEVRRHWLPARPSTGDTGYVSYDIRFMGGVPPLWIEISDPLIDQAGKMEGLRMFTGFRRHVILPAAVSSLQRGVYSGGRVQITCGDVFGWFKRSLFVEADGLLTVIPQTAVLPAKPGILEQGDGTTSLYGPEGRERGTLIRDYQQGDSWRSIHWKSSARKSSLLARQSEDSGPVMQVFLLVTDPACYSPGAVEFETAVSYTASLLRREAEGGRGAGLVLGGPDGRMTYRCEPDQDKGMELLAAAKLVSWTPGHHLLIETVQENIYAEITCLVGQLTRELAAAAASAAIRGIKLEIVITGDEQERELPADPADQSRELIEQLRHTGVEVRRLNSSTLKNIVAGGNDRGGWEYAET
ncbi:DUF58 domain-containing protein [Paenibacillus sp. J22TS3]|uniref:DUF58 domain-containing protein n=1 Tax=Paenibacillus sp. J22TS3 TaxID=2807192 RepID=UPI001B096E52|nr:DUF58 domain-containing protein [Paenibacillus sp. J22TS3]GIP23713.1 hypothetical protein J22TS3_39880 [Paenibacillus sp. J22TS3]